MTSKFIIPQKIWGTLTELTKAFDEEWTLFGKTEVSGDNLRLVEFRVCKQENGSGSTDVSEDDFAEFVEKLITDGEDTQNWNVWIHSHHSMGAFFSGTDTAQMETFGKQGAPFIISIVLSSGEKKALCWFSFFKPIRVDIEMDIEVEPDESTLEEKEKLLEKIDKLQVAIQKMDTDFVLKDKLEAEIKAKTVKKTYATYGKGAVKHVGNCYCNRCQWDKTPDVLDATDYIMSLSNKELEAQLANPGWEMFEALTFTSDTTFSSVSSTEEIKKMSNKEILTYDLLWPTSLSTKPIERIVTILKRGKWTLLDNLLKWSDLANQEIPIETKPSKIPYYE